MGVVRPVSSPFRGHRRVALPAFIKGSDAKVASALLPAALKTHRPGRNSERSGSCSPVGRPTMPGWQLEAVASMTPIPSDRLKGHDLEGVV